MAQLTVRGVAEDIVAALKARVAWSGRSAEAEHRRILEEALRPDWSDAFYEAARARRVKLPPDAADTTDLLRHGRDRGGV